MINPLMPEDASVFEAKVIVVGQTIMDKTTATTLYQLIVLVGVLMGAIPKEIAHRLAGSEAAFNKFAENIKKDMPALMDTYLKIIAAREAAHD